MWNSFYVKFDPHESCEFTYKKNDYGENFVKRNCELRKLKRKIE